MSGQPHDPTYQPYNVDSINHACCRLNFTTPDVCFGNGLCLSTLYEYAGTVWAEGCTTVGGGNGCAAICQGKRNSTVDFWNILPFPEKGAWCCRGFRDFSSCCNNASLAVHLASDDVTPLSISSGQQTDTSSGISPSSASSPASTSCPPVSASLGDGHSTAMAGGIVGGILGTACLVVALIAARVIMENRRLKAQREDHRTSFKEPNLRSISDPSTCASSQHFQASSQPRLASELHFDSQRFEAPSSPAPQLLP